MSEHKNGNKNNPKWVASEINQLGKSNQNCLLGRTIESTATMEDVAPSYTHTIESTAMVEDIALSYTHTIESTVKVEDVSPSYTHNRVHC